MAQGEIIGQIDQQIAIANQLIAMNIAAARIEKRLKIEHVAEMLDILPDEMQAYESGGAEIPADLITPFAAVLGISPEWLLRGVDEIYQGGSGFVN